MLSINDEIKRNKMVKALNDMKWVSVVRPILIETIFEDGSENFEGRRDVVKLFDRIFAKGNE